MTPRLFIVPLPLTHAMVFAVLLSAFWKGGWRERLVASVFAAPTALHFLLGHRAYYRVSSGPWAVALDLALLVACLICVHRARRYWVIWAAALALLEVVGDMTMLLDPKVTYWAAASAGVIFSWILGPLLIWASFTARKVAVE